MNRYCNGVIHTVRKGDTLYSLSRQYDVPLVAILRANPYVDIYNLMIGSRICIPTGPQGRPPRPAIPPMDRPPVDIPPMDIPPMDRPQAMPPVEEPQEIPQMRPSQDSLHERYPEVPLNRYPEESQMNSPERMWMDDTDMQQNRMRKENVDDDDNDRRIAYVVKEGESMKDILDKFGEDAEDFLENNRLSDIFLKPGITVFVEADR
ncbi:MAG: LysM peptidoglycan-binding domain-containing protein [Lachnospiraceae bacterium]|nr:LysM peptidoglycan-binding domain-containing protein [Lachnospiraceae bacterium]